MKGAAGPLSAACLPRARAGHPRAPSQSKSVGCVAAGSVGQVRSTISDQVRGSGAGGLAVLRQGFLLKRGTGVPGRRSWDRRFFTLTSDGALNYYSEKVLQRDPGSLRLSINSKEVRPMALQCMTVYAVPCTMQKHNGCAGSR